MRFGTNPFILGWGWLCLPLLAGCSHLYRTTSTQVAVNPSNGGDVEIFQNAWTWEAGVHYAYRGTGMGWLALDNSASVHLIRLEQPGHFPLVHPVFPTTPNPYKWVDGGAAAGLAVVSAIGGAREAAPAFKWGALAGAAFNAWGLFTPPHRVYDRAYYFEALTSMPKGQPTDPPLRIEGFHMHIPEGQHSWHYFENMDHYSHDRVEFVSASDESIDIEYSNLDESLNATLQAQGFQAESETGMFQRGNAIQLTGQLTAVREHRVQNIVRYELETEWWLYNAFGLRADTARVTTQSNWALYNFSNPGFDRDLIAEAIDVALFEALETPTFHGKLNRIEDLESEWTKEWTPLSMHGAVAPAGKVSAAVPSVVTVAASDGHGSGCIVSSDGYIVTNYHVIADGAESYTVYFHDGKSLPAHIVRYHPVHDLALIKVDTTGLLPFHVQQDVAIDVGEEAFALGTPYDIDLGASVTKGIISGRRKDGTRTLIQTDVSISPGNSGGALVNSQGALIGVINEKVLGLGVEGIGFAIPAASVSAALMLEF